MNKTIAFLILFISMFFSIKVMCYGLVVYSLIALYLNTYYTDKLLGYSFMQQIKAVVPYFALSLVVFGEALLFSFLIENNLVSLLVSLIVCPITYFMLTKIAGTFAYKEAIALMRESRFRL